MTALRLASGFCALTLLLISLTASAQPATASSPLVTTPDAESIASMPARATILAPTGPASDHGLRRVLIDPGHGGENEGAPCLHREGHSHEKTYTLIISNHVANHLRAAGVEVLMSRTRDEEVSLSDRVRMANQHSVDALISIHLNSSRRQGPTGHEAFFLSVNATDEAARRLARFENGAEGDVEAATEAASTDPVAAILQDLSHTRSHQDAEKLAWHIAEGMIPHSPFPSRGVKQAPFTVLMGARMPAVVVEVGFINHPKEGRYITSEAGMAALAKGIADGILEYGRLVVSVRRHSMATPFEDTPGPSDP